MAFSIVASPDPLFLEPDASRGVVTVHYVCDPPGGGVHEDGPFIWERTDDDPWSPIDVHSERVISSTNPGQEGLFHTTLDLGRTCQVLMYHVKDADPNVAINDPYEPIARCSTMALRKGPPSSALVDVNEHDGGGTWFGCYPQTSVDTRAVLEISRDAPTPDSDGVLHVTGSIGRNLSVTFGQGHALEVASAAMLPGHPYFALLLVFGKDGAWEQRVISFTAKQRRVAISLEEIWIINDGDYGHNTASFRVWVAEGPKIVAEGHIPEREITDRPSPGEEFMEHIPLYPFISAPIVLGPSVIYDGDNAHARNRSVAILTRGIASVTVGTDDISGNFLPGPASNAYPDEFQGTIFPGAHLRFPIGRTHETVDDRQFSTRAIPLTGGNEFTYEVSGRYTVTYP